MLWLALFVLVAVGAIALWVKYAKPAVSAVRKEVDKLDDQT